MDEEELKSVTSILDALILKHQARRVLGEVICEQGELIIRLAEE